MAYQRTLSSFRNMLILLVCVEKGAQRCTNWFVDCDISYTDKMELICTSLHFIHLAWMWWYTSTLKFSFILYSEPIKFCTVDPIKISVTSYNLNDKESPWMVKCVYCLKVWYCVFSFLKIMSHVYNYPRLPYNSSKGKWICALGCCYSGCCRYKEI